MPETPPIPPTLVNRLSHPCFTQPESKNLKVWRYMSLAKFIWLLKEKKLFLSRLDELGDPYEGSHTVKTIERLQEWLKRRGIPDRWTDLSADYRWNRAHTVVCCWHVNDYESEAMWRLYSNQGNGVAIQSTYGDLVKSIENEHEVYIGCIQYIDYSNDMFPSANIYDPAMHKRVAFSHEREVRLVLNQIMASEPSKGAETGPQTTINWDPDVWVQKIYIDPYAPGYFFDAVNTVIGSLAPNLLPRVEWSRMREPPRF